MIRKWKWLLLAVAILFLASGLWFAFHDRPAFSKDEVTAMVNRHFESDKSYFKVDTIEYAGAGKWTGSASGGIPWWTVSRFNFYEKSRVTELK